MFRSPRYSYTKLQSSLFLRLFIAAGVVVCGLSAGAYADEDQFEEVHQYQHEVLSPAYGNTFTDTFQVQQFDTMGGARDLLGVVFDYRLSRDITWVIHDNPYDYAVMCEVRSTMSWFGEIDEGVLLPMEPGMRPLGVTDANGVWRVPFELGESWQSVGGGTGYGDATADPLYLEPLTGSGLHPIESTMELSGFEKCPIGGGGEGSEGAEVFWPELLDINIDRLYFDLTVRYVYTPEPGTAVLACLGGVVLLRRRR